MIRSRYLLLTAILTTMMIVLSACRARPEPAIAAAPASPSTTPVQLSDAPTPSHTPTPSPVPTLTPTSTDTPRPTATLTPTSTPTMPPAPRQLTTGGCCFGPFFLDGKVTFLDKPSARAPVGFYVATLAGGEPQLVETRLGIFQRGGDFFVYQDKQKIIIERRRDGTHLAYPALDKVENPTAIVLSPDGSQISWSIRETEGPFDRRQTQLWRAAQRNPQGELVLTLFGGGLNAWLSDNRWLLSGRRNVEEADRLLFIYDLNSRQTTELARASAFRSVSVSPDGQWVALLIAFDPQHERNGLWLLRVDGTERRKLDFFGAFAWRDAGRLFYIPFQQTAQAHEVWLYNITHCASVRLTDAAKTPFKIAQGDFAFAPDGSGLVYVSAADLNLWWLPLPPDLTELERTELEQKSCPGKTPSQL